MASAGKESASCVPPLLLEELPTPPAEACPPLGTRPAHPEAVPAVLQLRVGAGSGTGSGSRPGLGQSAASSAESSGAGAAPGMFLTLPCGFLSWGAGFRLGRGSSALQPTALLQDQSLLRYVPNDFCAELPWYSLSISVFDLLHFCRITDSHHQDTVRMACAPRCFSSLAVLMGRALAAAGVTPALAAVSPCGGSWRAGGKRSSPVLPSQTAKAAPRHSCDTGNHPAPLSWGDPCRVVMAATLSCPSSTILIPGAGVGGC